LGEADFTQEALDCLVLAQSFYTETAEPYEWANLERQIGNALIEGRNGGNAENRRLASRHFRNAIRVYEAMGRVALASSVSKVVDLNEQILRLQEQDDNSQN
jgi:hypothetical protein